MAKRYGRNQKRKAREEIAQLRDELDWLKYGPFERAQPGDPTIPVDGAILDEGERRSVDRKRRTDVEMTITLFEAKDDIMNALYDRSPIAWRGLRWIPRDATMDRNFVGEIIGCGKLTLTMTALARRDHSFDELKRRDVERRYH